MRPMFKTKILILQSKGNLYEKILYGKITHLVGQELSKMLVGGMFGNGSSTFRFGPLSTCYWNYYSISETNYWIKGKSQCHINHGPELNVEFSIPIQTPFISFPHQMITGSARNVVFKKNSAQGTINFILGCFYLNLYRTTRLK